MDREIEKIILEIHRDGVITGNQCCDEEECKSAEDFVIQEYLPKIKGLIEK